jgi:hypothetical protein
MGGWWPYCNLGVMVLALEKYNAQPVEPRACIAAIMLDTASKG